MFFKAVLMGLGGYLGVVSTVSAQTVAADHLIVSQCMMKYLSASTATLAKTPQFSLIATELTDGLMAELEAHHKECGKFLNLDAYSQELQTKDDAQRLLLRLTQAKPSLAAPRLAIRHEAQVQAAYQSLDPNKIWNTNQHLTHYTNRYAKSATGVEAAKWFKAEFDRMAQEYQRKDVESYLVNTGTKYPQPSVVTIIGNNKTSEAIVIGAHIDTLDGDKPGADDDASGISILVETARVLLSSGLTFDHPIYIIAYAAEEQGLVGSSYVVKSFINKKIPVKAVMQLDQAGYRANPKDKTIWLMKDYVNKPMTQFLSTLLTHYVKIPVAYTQCGYACSDHANWHKEGYAAVYPSGTTLDDDNPYIHTSEDTLNLLNLEHMVHFTQLALAFAIELGIR